MGRSVFFFSFFLPRRINYGKGRGKKEGRELLTFALIAGNAEGKRETEGWGRVENPGLGFGAGSKSFGGVWRN